MPSQHSHKGIFTTMLIFGIAGLLASFALTVEEMHLLKDPSAVLSCSINVVLNCSEVMKTWQASIFGFPNMLIGLMAYPVVITTAVVGLTRATLPKWYWLTASAVYGLGLIFAYWLFFQSVYVIEVLCPWCLIVTFATTVLFETITRYNIRQNNFMFPPKIAERIQYIVKKDYDIVMVALWVVIMVTLVILKFGEGLYA